MLGGSDDGPGFGERLDRSGSPDSRGVGIAQAVGFRSRRVSGADRVMMSTLDGVTLCGG